MRQLAFRSRTRNSWLRGPILGNGREWGIGRCSPCCKRRKSHPTSRRAACDSGGVLISPCSQRSGLLICSIHQGVYVISDMLARARPIKASICRLRFAALAAIFLRSKGIIMLQAPTRFPLWRSAADGGVRAGRSDLPHPFF